MVLSWSGCCTSHWFIQDLHVFIVCKSRKYLYLFFVQQNIPQNGVVSSLISHLRKAETCSYIFPLIDIHTLSLSHWEFSCFCCDQPQNFSFQALQPKEWCPSGLTCPEKLLRFIGYCWFFNIILLAFEREFKKLFYCTCHPIGCHGNDPKWPPKIL